MKVLVQKFGGTSVSTEARRKLVIEKVKKAIGMGYQPVVVVSAMGREGDPYATDTLLSLVDRGFKESNPLAADLLMGCGEIISTVVMTNELNKSGIEAIPLTGGQAGIITDSTFSNAKVLRVNPEPILSMVKDGKVPIVAGFQGVSEDGYVTTLGRGGSDVTAALLGAAVNSKKVEIYTDVDGIMTADPRIVPDATLIKKISYHEVFQLADQGAKVIHPRAVEIAMKANLNLYIKNTLSDSEGTHINGTGSEENGSIITGITSMGDRVQIRVTYHNNDAYDNLFDVLATHLISIDLINVFPKEKIFTIDGKDLQKFNLIMKNLDLSYSCIEGCSKIALIGSRMRGIPGVMAKILKALTREGIEVLQTADSYMTIWCLVEAQYAKKAINALHEEFKLA